MFNELLIKQHGKIVRSRPVRSRCRFFLVNKQTNVRSRPLEMPIYYKMRLNFKRSSRELHLRNLCCTLPEDVDFVSTRCNKLYCKTQPVQKCLLYIDLIDYFRCKNTYFLEAFCVLGNSCLCLQLFRELNQAVLASFFDVYQVVRQTSRRQLIKMISKMYATHWHQEVFKRKVIYILCVCLVNCCGTTIFYANMRIISHLDSSRVLKVPLCRIGILFFQILSSLMSIDEKSSKTCSPRCTFGTMSQPYTQSHLVRKYESFQNEVLESPTHLKSNIPVHFLRCSLIFFKPWEFRGNGFNQFTIKQKYMYINVH